MADVDPNPLWKRQLMVRCGNRKGLPGQRAVHFCHHVANAHYGHTLTAADLRRHEEDTEEDMHEETNETNSETEEEEAPVEAALVEASEEALEGAPSEANEEAKVVIDLTLEDGTNQDNAIDLGM